MYIEVAALGFGHRRAVRRRHPDVAGIIDDIGPPICRVKSVSQVLVKDFGTQTTKENIIRQAMKRRDQLSKNIIRVLKYGEEMPDWVEYPYVIYKEQQSDDDEDVLNYHMPGGMTIKPDKEAHSHFIPWYHVVVSDVGAMYPTILKAMNIGADTVKLAKRNEPPDAWVWLKKLPDDFLKTRDVNWREITKQDSYADRGYMTGPVRTTVPTAIIAAVRSGKAPRSTDTIAAANTANRCHAGAVRPPGTGFHSEMIALVDTASGLQGRSVWTAERGDQVFSELEGEGTVARNRIRGTILGGTGRYAGATGSYEFSWQFVMEAEDGSIQGRAIELKGRVRLGPGAGDLPK